MKKLILISILFSCLSIFTVKACPLGTHPVGGTGTHHKGGTCV